MKLIGKHSTEAEQGGTYLVGPDEFDLDADEPGLFAPVRMLDISAGTLRGPVPFGSMIAHVPYFEPYEGDDGELEALLKQVEPAEGAPPKDRLGDPQVGPETEEANTSGDDDTASDPTVVSLQTASEVNWMAEGRREQRDDNH